MSGLQDVIAGFVTGLGLIAAIGPQNVFIIRQGVARMHVFAVALTAALCDAVLITAGVAGLGAVVASTAWLATATALGGALFLLVYGVLSLRSAVRGGATPLATGGTAAGSVRGAVLATLAISLLNPHVYLDTVVLLGGIGGRLEAAGRTAFTAGAVMASLMWFFGLAFGARALAPVFRRPAAQRLLDLFVAAVMFGVAFFLLRDVVGA
ncbi:MAG TPA: LysE/ArgO family amino acid transporter [Deinococcales bacterium]|nr:LysE/ArgO family amino acid transporter [Deinococcales bacterium]